MKQELVGKVTQSHVGVRLGFLSHPLMSRETTGDAGRPTPRDWAMDPQKHHGRTLTPQSQSRHPSSLPQEDVGPDLAPIPTSPSQWSAASLLDGSLMSAVTKEAAAERDCAPSPEAERSLCI